MKNRINFLVICIFIFISCEISAQKRNNATENYIITYKKIALENEKNYGIPACITLAQGILESGSGRSTLAKESNNHFGIKCHNNWQGDKIYKDDDNKNDCFRVYQSAEESFTDHSIFLTTGRRYQQLFELDKTDYKSWAEGLKQAGYATNPKYAELLIEIIEIYDLNKLNDKDFYLTDNIEIQEESIERPIIKNEQKEELVETKRKQSLIEKLFGNMSWYKHRHETPKEKERRLMDKKIQKMIDEKDVKRSDFEIEFQ